jgi:xanthine dehydrogenase YagT iron-sulfur-binding subunit
MNDHDSNKEPDTPNMFGVTRRTVIETEATALLLTALPVCA